MKGKQLFILLLLAALAGGAWYYLSKRNGSAWSATGGGGGKVIEFPINDVARLKIKGSAGEVNLVKKGDLWTVQERADYPANFEQVSGLLRKLWELKTVQEVKVGASQMARLELEEPGKGDKAGTVVEFIGADGKALGGLLLGKKHVRKSEGGGGPMDFGGFPTGRYVKPVSGAKVSLVSEPFDDVEPKPERWLAKDFVKIDGPKSIAVAGQTDAQKWTVTRENATAEWKLADARPDEKADSSKTFALGNIFSAPNFNDVLAPDAKPADSGLDKPTTATIETFDGFRYELKIGKASGENFPVLVSVSANLAKERTPGKDEKPEDKTKLDEEFKTKLKQQEEKLAAEQKFAGRTYLVAKFAVEPLLKDRAALLPDKPAEPAPAPAPSATAPPVSVTTPPVSIPAPKQKVEAVTPPVSVSPPASTPAGKPAPPPAEKPASAPPADKPAPPAKEEKPAPSAAPPAEQPAPPKLAPDHPAGAQPAKP